MYVQEHHDRSLSILTRSQPSVTKTGVEPFMFLAPPPPKPRMPPVPPDALTQPSTGRSRQSTFSLGMAHTITQPPTPIPPSATFPSPIFKRSMSADSLSTKGGGLGLNYKSKWRGGNLQLSHSNLRPKQRSRVIKEGRRGRTP